MCRNAVFFEAFPGFSHNRFFIGELYLSLVETSMLITYAYIMLIAYVYVRWPC